MLNELFKSEESNKFYPVLDVFALSEKVTNRTDTIMQYDKDEAFALTKKTQLF